MNPEPTPPPDEPEEIEHVAYGRQLVTCVRCGCENALDPARDAAKQHCEACGSRLARRRKRRRWFTWFTGSRAPNPATPAKERVWVPVLGAALAATGAAIFLLWMLLKPNPVESAPAPVAVPLETEIHDLIERFTSARTAAEILPLLRDPDRHAPAVRAWSADPANPLPLGGSFVEGTRPRPALGHEILSATVLLGQDRLVQMLCVKTPAGWRVDWGAFLHAGDLSPAAFLARKSPAPTLVYVIAQKSTYYNGPYADSAAWLNLRLTDPTGATTFYAAVPRSQAALVKALEDIPPPADAEGVDLPFYSRRKVLRLQFTRPELSPPQAEVTAVEGDGWFVP